MEKLELKWTKDVERFVEDMEVLGELVPPTTLEWFVGSILFHLPNLVYISMSDFPKCNSLPPLGQLPNLKYLVLERMNGISEINWDLCGSRRAFPQLESFTLCGMERLKVWYTIYPGGRDGVSEFMFPKLSDLNITDCPNLRIKPWQLESQISVTSSASVPVHSLIVSGCKVPMHQWRLLHYLHSLTELTIYNFRDLSSSPEIS
jgi:hypothetical protein